MPILGLTGSAATTALTTGAVAASLSLVYAGLEMPDSLVAKWLVRPLAIASASTVDPTGGLPTGVGSTTSTTTPAPAPIRPTKIGINITPPLYYQTTRVFSNLATGGWFVTPASGGSTDGYYDANRNVIKVLTGDVVQRAIQRPNDFYRKKSVDVVCKWDGVGFVDYLRAPSIANAKLGANSFTYTSVNLPGEAGWEFFFLKSVDASNPVRNFDCREAGSDPNQVFDPEFIAFLKRFNTVRFMDWQNTNGNQPITWATRTTRSMGPIAGTADGYAIEYMIELANTAKVNPWFCMPWNADDDYIRKFAEMVRDRLDPGLVAYVETSNEVWNFLFQVSNQALAEGQAEQLSTDAFQAMLYRYAEKTGHVMDIWKDVFTGQQNRLVRVASNQSGNPWTIQQVLGFRDTATKIDAIASAPYFYADANAYTDTPASIDTLFVDLKTDLDQRVNIAKQWKQIADGYHLRNLTYEAGQHILGNATVSARAQYDPRMGQIYQYYLSRWNNEIGDLMMLYNDYGGVSQYGAWGMLEDVSKSPMSTPKSKAVTLFLASINNK